MSAAPRDLLGEDGGDTVIIGDSMHKADVCPHHSSVVQEQARTEALALSVEKRLDRIESKLDAFIQRTQTSDTQATVDIAVLGVKMNRNSAFIAGIVSIIVSVTASVVAQIVIARLG